MGDEVDISSLDGIATQLIGPAQTRVVKTTTSILEFGLLAVALTAWLVIGVPASLGFMVPGPGWSDLYVPATVVFVLALLTPIVTLLRPTWTRFRIAAHIVVDLATIALGFASLALGSWVVLADPATATTDQVALVDMINTIVRISIAATVVLTVVYAALELRRLVRMRAAELGRRFDLTSSSLLRHGKHHLN